MLPRVEGERATPKVDLSKLQKHKISTIVNDGPLKVYVGGIPPEMDEEGLIKILADYGHLKSLHVVRER